MRTSLALLLLSLVPCLATSRKDHYRFRDDMPADEDDDHNNGYSNSILSLSRCRHNYHERTEAGMNRQINFFMHAGYVYNSMAHYFGRCDVALPGFQKFFQQLTQEQRERSETLMNYQNLRGGFITLQPVTAPSNSEWGSGRDAMIQALDLEKSVNQVEKIFTISQYITNLERVGSGLGEYMFDKLPQN
ncbi:soma ferritin-like isoform X2 [Homarus americanus]|uniref:soma ferritin-like isoform X2 n=1 Tax=Homarus americanus TaxID=6706 RepID=UPI001C471DB2|nr:soma ferritin-like isoform X2 [Homarus americanus]